MITPILPSPIKGEGDTGYAHVFAFRNDELLSSVIPGAEFNEATRNPDKITVFIIYWIPAFAGMTRR